MLTLQDKCIKLSSDKIYFYLNKKFHALIDDIQVFNEIESTNKSISTLPISTNYTILLAESQTNGYGRRQKKWVSPNGKNIYLSISFHLDTSINIHLLPLVIAISICKSLNKMDIKGCQIKWPNDIYLNGKKLGGILVETKYNIQQGYKIIVGIGLNINMKHNNNIDQLWTSLAINKNKIFDRNIIVSAILSELIVTFLDIHQLNKSQFLVDWDYLDYLKGKNITVMEENLSYSAKALGIANDGALIIEYLNKNVNLKKKIYSADVSIKSNKE